MKQCSVAKVHRTCIDSIIFWPEPSDEDGGAVGVPRAVVAIGGRPLEVVVGGGERLDATVQGHIGQHRDGIRLRVRVQAHLVCLP